MSIDLTSDSERFWSKVDKTGSCWIWLAAKRHKGYGQFRFNGTTAKAHRVAWELVHGSSPGNNHVLHKCDNPACVNPEHLMLGSNRENVMDMLKKGRQGRKLSQEDAAAIKKADRDGVSRAEIAKRFSVTTAQVSNITTGKQWRAA